MTIRTKLIGTVLAAMMCISAAHAAESPRQLTVDDIGAGYEWIRSYRGGQSLFAFYPPGKREGSGRTAVVFIHGGGWTSGHPSFFFPHCQYFAARGAMAFSVQYRLATAQSADGLEQIGSRCLADCKSAIRYIRENSAKLGIDPDKIVVSGDSAGGHLAAALGLIGEYDNPDDDLTVSARPQASVCFNPVADTNSAVVYRIFGIENPGEEARRIARTVSPVDNVKSGAPPMLIMHGTADTVIPIEQSERLTAAMKRAGNRCDLIKLEGAPHAFSINWAGTEETIVRSLTEMDRFMGSLGLIDGDPAIVMRK